TLDGMSGCGADRADNLLEILSFLVHVHAGLEGGIVPAVGKPNPFPLSARVDDLRIVFADRGIQQNRGAYFVSVERLHHPPDADANAGIPPTVVERIRRQHRRSAKDACRWFVDLEMLDVQTDVKRDSRAVGPSQL